MASTANYLDPRVLAELQGLTLRTRHVVEGFLSGMHRSAHIGSSMDYSQHRPYVAGDDLRRVDWKAYGRTDRLYVKEFMDETNLACTFVLDASRSMSYRGERSALSKFEYAACLISSLAWLLRDQGDAVGLNLCNEGRDVTVPSAANEYQLPHLMEALEAAEPESDDDFAMRLRDWAARVFDRQLVVLVSDLFGDEGMLLETLVDLRQYGHDVMVFQICDPDEVDFPFDQYTRFHSLETGKSDLVIDARWVRASYREQFQNLVDRIRQRCLQLDVEFVSMVTDQFLGTALGQFLVFRNQQA